MRAVFWLGLGGLGCTSPELLELPEDPSESGVVVGRRAVDVDGLSMELFYPASEAHRDDSRADASLLQWVSPEVDAALGDVAIPPIAVDAVLDAELRDTEEPWPVVLFSHGLAGYRLQSVDLTAHLASRGYLVVAVDHPGRLIADFLPCLFDPALEGCDLSGLAGGDPGPDDMEAALDWLRTEAEGGSLAGRLDLDRLAIVGHSAGGGTAGEFGSDEDAVRAVVSLAGAPSIERDVPALLVGGDCDNVVSPSRVRGAFEEAPVGTVLVELEQTGHMAFSDICALDLPRLAEEELTGRDDINETLLGQLVSLAGDGCADRAVPETIADECPAWADTDVTHPRIRAVVTRFLDAALGGGGPAVVAAEGMRSDVR